MDEQKGGDMRVRSTGEFKDSKLKLLIYGESGNGKTTLAATCPGKTLIANAESGLLSLADHELDVVDIAQDDNGNIIPKHKRIARLKEIYQFVLQPEQREKYDYLVLDSITEISQCALDEAEYEYPNRSDSLVKFGEVAKTMRSLIKAFRDIPYYHVVMTALAIEERGPNGERYKAVDMVGKISQQCPQFFDEVFYLGIFEDGEYEGKRYLQTQSSPRAIAKDRSSKLAPLERADLTHITNKILGG